MKFVLDGSEGEYSGQVDKSGTLPDGRGVFLGTDLEFYEGRWADGERVHGRTLSKDGKNLYKGSFKGPKRYDG